MPNPIIYPTLAMLVILTMSSMAVSAVAVLAPEIAVAIDLDAKLIGVFTAVLYAAAALIGAVTGTLIPRYGAIRVCQLMMVLAAGGVLCISLASPVPALLSALLLGLAYGPFNPASAHVLWGLASSRWQPLIFSVKQMGVPLGGALAGALLPLVAVTYGWQTAALSVGALAILAAAAIQPLRRHFDVDRGAAQPLRKASFTEPLRLALGDPALRRYTICACALAGCQISVGAFMVVYLTEALKMSLVQAGVVFAFLQGGGFAGRPLWGALAGGLVPARQLLVMLGIGVTACLVLTALLSAESPPLLVIALATALGMSSFGWNGVLLSEVASQAPSGKVVEATAGMQFVMFAGIVVFPVIFGGVVYFSGSYGLGFTFLGGLAIVGAAVMLDRGERLAKHP